MDNNTSYIQSTSEYISEVKPSFIKISNRLKQVVNVIKNMDSPRQTKKESKEALVSELSEVARELDHVVTKTGGLSHHINDLAQSSNGKD